MKLKVREKMIGAWPQFSEEYGFLGHLLHSERLLKGIPLEKVAEDLKLSTYVIQSLETGQLDQTPGFSYMIGFIRTYARYLGLSARELVEALQQKTSIFRNEMVLKNPLRASQLPSRSVVLGAAFFVVAMFSLYVSTQKRDKTATSYVDNPALDTREAPADGNSNPSVPKSAGHV